MRALIAEWVRYDRTIIAYHGCDVRTVNALLRGARFKPSENDFDWLGRGIYFWEFGVDRAYRFAEDQMKRGRVQRPAVVGAILQLGKCFDLMDTRFTSDLAGAHAEWKALMRAQRSHLPQNAGATPDRKLRRRDCAVLNWYFDRIERGNVLYDTIRCGFVEGGPVFPRSGIYREAHIQIAVRNPDCILGVFKPMMGAS